MPPKTFKDAPSPKAWHPPHYELADVSAVQSLIQGNADSDQQQRAVAYIVNVLCAAYDMPYRPESSRDTDFALGRMFVGQQIVKLSRINLSTLRKNDGDRAEQPG